MRSEVWEAAGRVAGYFNLRKNMKFRRIPGFPDYRVSKTGVVQSRRVYGSPRRAIGPWWEMKYKRNKKRPNYYPYIDLFREVGKPERFFIHELVLLTYVGPKPEGLVSRHLDDNKENNCLENLCYGTQSENMQDAFRNGGIKVGEDSHSASRLTNAQVLTIRKRIANREPFEHGEKIKFYKRLAEIYGVRYQYIQRIHIREIWKHV